MNNMVKDDLVNGLSDNRNFAKHNYKGVAYFKFRCLILVNYLKAFIKLLFTLIFKKCYYGPFKGEFGHFTAHNLPFLMYLHKKGVKIIYCGMELHMPFLVDENRNSIIHDFRPLRDFFAEVTPNTNATIPPEDVQVEIKKFELEAKKSCLPFWNIGDDYYYWFIHRNWLLMGFTNSYDLEKAYKTKEEFSVCIFARNKEGAKTTRNNGAPWDYKEMIDKIKQYFDKVYITGHPSQSLAFESYDNVELCVTSDNAKTLEKCANSKLIITQHSGVNNLGEYTNNKVLIIYKGPLPIGSMNNTLRFRPSIGTRHELSFAYGMEEVVNFVKEFSLQHRKQPVSP